MSDIRLSAHFSLRELTHSHTAMRHGIDNYPHDPRIMDNLHQLCLNVLEPIRDWLGRPVYVSSGYRCEALNELVGGSPRSRHMLGLAADIIVPGMTAFEVASVLASEVDAMDEAPFEKLILEFYRWVHVQMAHPADPNPDNGVLLTALNDSAGRTVYHGGLVPPIPPREEVA